MSDESMSSAEGGGDDELVVMVEIKLADVTYGGTSAYLSALQLHPVPIIYS